MGIGKHITGSHKKPEPMSYELFSHGKDSTVAVPSVQKHCAASAFVREQGNLRLGFGIILAAALPGYRYALRQICLPASPGLRGAASTLPDPAASGGHMTPAGGVIKPSPCLTSQGSSLASRARSCCMNAFKRRVVFAPPFCLRGHSRL